jgi:carboxypeptidase T
MNKQVPKYQIYLRKLKGFMRKGLVMKGFTMMVFTIFLLASLVSALNNTTNLQQTNYPNISSVDIQRDQPLALPNWQDGDYHDYYATKEKLIEFNDDFPDLVSIFPIGTSVLNHDIWCIRITNEKNTSHKFSCLFDGCIHGNEWEGAEACLYFAEYLLINSDGNQSMRTLLNKSEIYLVPLVNPDGREKDDRFNENGIDLNRNFDVNFGRILGHCFPLGKLFGLIKIKWIGIPRTNLIWTNCGRHPFSEPESQAMRDLMKELAYHDFSFYLTCHTAQHYFSRPSNNIRRSEYELSPRELGVLDYAKSWVENNTEYRSAKDNNKFGYGSSADYCFKECHIPSFGLEILTPNLDPWFSHGKHNNLVHWMNTTLPIFMYLLVNIEKFHDWDTPDIEPLLPDGVPPPPLKTPSYFYHQDSSIP